MFRTQQSSQAMTAGQHRPSNLRISTAVLLGFVVALSCMNALPKSKIYYLVRMRAIADDARLSNLQRCTKSRTVLLPKSNKLHLIAEFERRRRLKAVDRSNKDQRLSSITLTKTADSRVDDQLQIVHWKMIESLKSDPTPSLTFANIKRERTLVELLTMAGIPIDEVHLQQAIDHASIAEVGGESSELERSLKLSAIKLKWQLDAATHLTKQFDVQSKQWDDSQTKSTALEPPKIDQQSSRFRNVSVSVANGYGKSVGFQSIDASDAKAANHQTTESNALNYDDPLQMKWAGMVRDYSDKLAAIESALALEVTQGKGFLSLAGKPSVHPITIQSFTKNDILSFLAGVSATILFLWITSFRRVTHPWKTSGIEQLLEQPDRLSLSPINRLLSSSATLTERLERLGLSNLGTYDVTSSATTDPVKRFGRSEKVQALDVDQHHPKVSSASLPVDSLAHAQTLEGRIAAIFLSTSMRRCIEASFAIWASGAAFRILTDDAWRLLCVDAPIIALGRILSGT